MPSQIEIRSVRVLLETLEQNDLPFVMYRGQSRDWPLLPSIGRYARAVRTHKDWQSFHEYIIERFLRLGHPHLSHSPISAADSWVIAQHHGLATRLLDTSTNPLKALFFAVNNPAEDRRDGVLWEFTYHTWREDLHDKHRRHWEAELTPFLPPQLTPRLTAQEGAFISYPLPAHKRQLEPVDKLPKHSLSMRKMIIPATSKARLRSELAALGIQFRLLFPDLDGVARSITLADLYDGAPHGFRFRRR